MVGADGVTGSERATVLASGSSQGGGRLRDCRNRDRHRWFHHGDVIRLAPSQIARTGLASRGVGFGETLAWVFGKSGRRVHLAIRADAAGIVGNHFPLDQHLTRLGDQFAADGQFLGHFAVGPVVVQLKLDLDGAAAFRTCQRQAVEQVDARGEVERFGEGAVHQLGLDHVMTKHHRRGVTVIAVDEQVRSLDLEDSDRWQTLPGVGIALDGKVIETIPQIEVGIENQVVYL